MMELRIKKLYILIITDFANESLYGYFGKRIMTTPLFLLRCVQLGISIRDLDLLTIGLVNHK